MASRAHTESRALPAATWPRSKDKVDVVSAQRRWMCMAVLLIEILEAEAERESQWMMLG